MGKRRITQVLVRLPYVAGAVDPRYGNTTNSFGAGIDLPVYAVSPKQSVEPDEVGRRAIITGLTVYAPAGSVIGARDRVLVAGKTYEVEGEQGSWTNNPHGSGFHDGIQFDLKRSEG